MNIKKNTLYNMIKSVSAIIFPMISFPYVSRILLTDNLGKVNYGNSIIGYFSLLAGLGIYTYAVRECSKVKYDKIKLEQLASELYSINICSTIISYALLFILLIFTRKLDDYRYLIVVQSMTIFFYTLGTDWINNVMEDFKYITIRTVVFQFVSLFLMFVFVKTPEDYIKYAFIVVLSNVGANVLNIFYRKKYVNIHFTLKMNIKKHLKPVLLLFSMMLAQTIYVNSDITILGVLKGDYEVGLYSVSVKIFNIVQALVNSVTLAILPQISYWYEKKNYSEINSLIRYGLDFTITLGLPCVVGMYILAPELIEILSGIEYIEATDSLRLLAIALMISFIAGILGNMIMLPSGRDKLCMISSIISALVNLILNIIFIPYYGLNAAAVTTIVAQMIGFFVKFPFVEKEIVIQNKKTLLFGPCCGSFFIIVITQIIRTLYDGVFFRTILIVLCSVIVYCIMLYIGKNELFLSILKKYISKEK